MPSISFECDFAELRFQGNLSSYIDWMVYFHGAYEPAVLAFLADAAQMAGPGSVFVDVGANVGLHTLYMALRVAKVHAFEPWPVVQASLRRNLDINALTNLTIHPFGLGDRNDRLPFQVPTTSNLGTGGFTPGPNASRPAELLPLRRGDDAFADAGIVRIDLMKVDTEGYEINTLAGMSNTLRALKPIVVVEISPVTIRELESSAHIASAMVELFWGRMERVPFSRIERIPD